MEGELILNPGTLTGFPQIMTFCDKSWNFSNFAPNFYQMCAFFLADIKKLSIVLEGLHVRLIPQNA